MSVFDLLAERRYEEWLKKVSASDYQPPEAVKNTTVRKSFEAYIFTEAVAHLDKASKATTDEQRAELLRKARELELQLILLLEKRQMPLAAATLRTSLEARREQVLRKK